MNYLGWNSQKPGSLFSLGWGYEELPDKKPVSGGGGGGNSSLVRGIYLSPKEILQRRQEDEVVIALVASFLELGIL